MNALKNYTPHEIVVIARESVQFNYTIRKYVASEDYKILQKIPSMGVLSAKIETVFIGTNDFGVPMYEKKITGFDALPEGNLIVSALYASAVAKLAPAEVGRLYTIADPVYTTDGKTVLGCLGICIVNHGDC